MFVLLWKNYFLKQELVNYGICGWNRTDQDDEGYIPRVSMTPLEHLCPECVFTLLLSGSIPPFKTQSTTGVIHYHHQQWWHNDHEYSSVLEGGDRSKGHPREQCVWWTGFLDKSSWCHKPYFFSCQLLSDECTDKFCFGTVRVKSGLDLGFLFFYCVVQCWNTLGFFSLFF